MSMPPCATMAKLSAALPKERRECAMRPCSTPLSGSPARRTNDVAFWLMDVRERSDPHSTAVYGDRRDSARRESDRTDQCLRERRQRSRRAQGQLEGLSRSTLEVGSLSADTSVLHSSLSTTASRAIPRRHARDGPGTGCI